MIVVPPIRNRKINPSGKSCLAFEGAVDGLSTSAYLGGKTALISSGWTGDCCKTATTPVLGFALTLSTAGSCAMAFSTDEAHPWQVIPSMWMICFMGDWIGNAMYSEIGYANWIMGTWTSRSSESDFVLISTFSVSQTPIASRRERVWSPTSTSPSITIIYTPWSGLCKS